MKKIHIIQSFINVLDCGIPVNKGISLGNIHDSDAIGIQRKMHITCLDGYEKEGSEAFICQLSGVWKSDLKCNKQCTFDYFISFYQVIMKWLLSKNSFYYNDKFNSYSIQFTNWPQSTYFPVP